MWETVVFIPAAVLRREREDEETRETMTEIERETQTSRDNRQTDKQTNKQTDRQTLLNSPMITYKSIKY